MGARTRERRALGAGRCVLGSEQGQGRLHEGCGPRELAWCVAAVTVACLLPRSLHHGHRAELPVEQSFLSGQRSGRETASIVSSRPENGRHGGS